VEVNVSPSKLALAEAAARHAAQSLSRILANRGSARLISATGASQFDFLEILTSTPGIDWLRVEMFHLDEYIGLDDKHLASFRRYLRENLTQRVPMEEFFEIDGNSSDPDRIRREYVQNLRAADPQLCLLGIGENGHLAFNDPAEADFDDHARPNRFEIDLAEGVQDRQGFLRLLYRGNDTVRSRDYRFLGSIGYFDALYLPLQKGENEILMAVSEDTGGWGLQAKFMEMAGISFQDR